MNKTGYGFLRLPTVADAEPKQVDYQALNGLVDRFLELGGTYFDTAYTYAGSEEALRRCLTQRHPRSAYRLGNKLPGYKVTHYSQCMDFFQEQLDRCGVTYFDVYMLHWLNKAHYRIAQETDQFRFLQELKETGLARATGFSYHDTPELLDEILTAHPEIDYVLLQINYLDWENPAIQSERCYETAVRHGKKVIVMEPVKGGNLAKLPKEAESLLNRYHPDWSLPAWAIRFASSLPQVETVLSGMNGLSQIEDNLQDFSPLGQRDFFLLLQAAQLIRTQTAIGCTGCGYCLEHCPQGIPIPSCFSVYNEYVRYPAEDWKLQPEFDRLNAEAPLRSCLDCGQCQAHCPQKLPIPQTLQKIQAVFGKNA